MTEIIHQIIFLMMVLMSIVTVVIGIERFIFSFVNFRRASAIIKAGVFDVSRDKNDSDQDLIANSLKKIIDLNSTSSNKFDDFVEAVYLELREKLFNRVWILDTVVTAAPLLGLLGTIFGIVETFLALSVSGNSDPAAISSGIATALYATAFGISIALVGLIIFNYLTDRNEKICEYFKILVLKHIT
jgi:biopolymer transport protein ExbB